MNTLLIQFALLRQRSIWYLHLLGKGVSMRSSPVWSLPREKILSLQIHCFKTSKNGMSYNKNAEYSSDNRLQQIGRKDIVCLWKFPRTGLLFSCLKPFSSSLSTDLNMSMWNRASKDEELLETVLSRGEDAFQHFVFNVLGIIQGISDTASLMPTLTICFVEKDRFL